MPVPARFWTDRPVTPSQDSDGGAKLSGATRLTSGGRSVWRAYVPVGMNEQQAERTGPNYALWIILGIIALMIARMAATIAVSVSEGVSDGYIPPEERS